MVDSEIIYIQLTLRNSLCCINVFKHAHNSILVAYIFCTKKNKRGHILRINYVGGGVIGRGGGRGHSMGWIEENGRNKLCNSI